MVAFAWPALPYIAGSPDRLPPKDSRFGFYTADGALIGEYGEGRAFVRIRTSAGPQSGRFSRRRGRPLLPASGRRSLGILRAAGITSPPAESARAPRQSPMQVARNFFSPRKTISRKLYEILSPSDRAKSHEDQISRSISQIFLGRRACGSRWPPQPISANPSATWNIPRGRHAGRPAQGTVGLQPGSQSKRAALRQQYVLRRMMLGFITPRPNTAGRRHAA